MRWAVGAVVGAFGLVVCGLTFYLCTTLFTAPLRPGQTRLTYVVIAYGLGFAAVLGALACIRLIIPKSSADGRLFSPWALRVLAAMYFGLVVLGLATSEGNGKVTLIAIMVGVVISFILRATFRRPGAPD